MKILNWLDRIGRKRIILDRIHKEPYLTRYYIFLKDRKWFPFNFFIHNFHKGDPDDLHDEVGATHYHESNEVNDQDDFRYSREEIKAYKAELKHWRIQTKEEKKLKRKRALRMKMAEEIMIARAKTRANYMTIAGQESNSDHEAKGKKQIVMGSSSSSSSSSSEEEEANESSVETHISPFITDNDETSSPSSPSSADAYSPIIEEFHYFHDFTNMILIFIVLFIGYIIGSMLSNTIIYKGLLHGQVIECV